MKTRRVANNVSTQTHKSKTGCEKIQKKQHQQKQHQPAPRAPLVSLDYLEVSSTGRVIKDVVLECSKSILESTACLSRGKVEQTDRRALTSLTAESHSRLLIPPDTNSRLCFTFTSICRERREGKREAAQTLSHIRFLTFSICLSPTNFFSHASTPPPPPLSASPFTLSLTFSLSALLSLPYLPPLLICDPFWGSAETSSSLQPYSLLTPHLKFICKHGPGVNRLCQLASPPQVQTLFIWLWVNFFRRRNVTLT